MIKNFFSKNIGMKIASVLLSIILWFSVTSRGQSEVSIEVPIEMRNIPQTLEIVRQGAKSVSIGIKGQERLLKNLKIADVRVFIDLSNAKKGKGTYYIDQTNVSVPSTMTVTNINPSSVAVVLAETMSKTVPVKPVINGTPKAGFFVSSVEIEPKEVIIEGIRSEIANVRFLRTEPIDITDVSEDLAQDVRLDTGGRNIRTKTQDINVKVIVKARKKE